MEAARDEETGDAAARDQSRQRSSIPSFLFITFLLFMLTSHNGDEFLARHQYQDALKNLEYQLGNFTAWMNGTETNFTLPNQDPIIPPLLNDFNIHGELLDNRYATYYPNITGFIHGSSVFHNISLPALATNTTPSWNPLLTEWMSESNQTEILEKAQGWNWTASDKLAISAVEKFPVEVNGTTISKDVALIHGRIELTDSNTSEDLRLEFEGIHFINNGSVYGWATTPGSHIDIRFLPAIVPEAFKNETARLIQPELELRIKKLKTLIDDGIIDQDTNDDLPKVNCSFAFFAQLQPALASKDAILELEDEIQHPTGVWTIEPPKLSVTGLLLSSQCGIMYEIVDTEGLRSRTFFRKVTTYAGTAGIAYLALLILYSRQSERSRTPSGLSRVSRWSFLSQSTMDSVSFAGHITFAILAEGRPSLSLVAPAFLACILFVHEAQYAVLVHQIQQPESTPTNANPLTPAQPQPSTPPANNNAGSAIPSPRGTPTSVPGTPNQTGSPPQPRTPNPTPAAPTPTATTPPQLTPDQMTFWQFFVQHIRTDPQARLWIALFVFLTLIVRVILSPLLSMIFVVVTYSLIWLPQILRSIRRGRSSGLTKEYVVGTTVARLYLCLYFLGCPKNVLDVEPRAWAPYLALWVSFQACIVMLQDAFGPAFFLPARYQAAKSYDYHPPLPLADPLAAEQSVGDCAICMENIIVPNPNAPSLQPSEKRQSTTSSSEKDGDDDDPDLETGGLASSFLRERSVAGSGGGKRLLNAVKGSGRKNYSLAPCHHLFHTECLERWLAIKHICPQCRRPLPPL